MYQAWCVSSLVLMFADDTKIFRVIRNREDYTALQSDFELLQRWLQQWQLKFNVFKCKHLHFGAVHGLLWSLLSQWNTYWHHYNAQRPWSYLDDQLKFHNHTTQVTNKANRSQVLGLIKKKKF